VAEHLQTDHTELYVTSAQARDVIPLLPKLFDEPFADSSQIPTFLVSQLARRHVTVALAGDGGDELFCGYRRYFEALEGFFPAEDAAGAASSLGRVSQVAFLSRQLPQFVRRTAGGLWSISGKILPGRLSNAALLASQIFSDDGPNYRYLRNLNHWHDEDAGELGIVMSDSQKTVRELSDWLGHPPTTPAQFQQVWQAFDTLTYLPGDILTKVDRASMGVSLEGRTPLLDHRVVEFAWTLPQEFKVQGRTGKRILRDVLAKYVPRELFERPKVGFGVPIDAWLRGPLRDWAEDLLDERRLKREGYLNPAPIRQKWHEHLSGKVDWHYHLWDVLMFQAWLAENSSVVVPR
jgi:asparagine synthase (glutamine-hydrolysing)